MGVDTQPASRVAATASGPVQRQVKRGWVERMVGEDIVVMVPM